jgi:hypothetical protein
MRVDFIKVDVDGFELRVLKGARNTIAQFRPNILIELGYLVEDVGDSIMELLAFIHDDLGYAIYNEAGELESCFDPSTWYPFNTTKDYAMVPVERPFPPL